MFSRLGTLIARHWVLVILAWVAVVFGLKMAQNGGLTPRWDEVTYDGDLAHLPNEMTSVRGAELLGRAFPEDRAKSQIVLVVAHPDRRLAAPDLAFAGQLAKTFRQKQADLPILDVWTHRTDVVGQKLRSNDRHAVLVVLQLATEFMATENIDVLREIQEEVEASRSEAPDGLLVGISGSAAIGGDMLTSAAESIKNTETFAVVLVIGILLAVYRAPLLVVVPMLAIAASIAVATDLVALLAQTAQGPAFSWWDFKIFKTTKIFVVVILYGAGTDYCLFLIARYKEELAQGLSKSAAVARALGQVGEALAASALTTIVGLATMMFADFGKFASSGPAIAICLAVTLIACITLAPALLCGFGKIVFWPFGIPESPSGAQADLSSETGFWPTISRLILARPGLILAASLLLMMPIAYQGLSVEITYDLVGELRADRPSVQGTAILRRHFPAGETGPLTILALKEDGGFDRDEGEKQIALLTKKLYDMEGVSSVRSIAEPLGNRPGFVNPFSKKGLSKMAAKSHPLTKTRFVAQVPELKGAVARFDLILADDPFSREATDLLEQVVNILHDLAQREDSAWHGVTFQYVGTTAGIRDLKMVTESDQRLIQQLAALAVLAVLLFILRRPVVCIYLILSVLFSYFVAIGTTELVFKWLYGATFDGLDWKVPLFLFVILIAVGEDYNIYLATRVFEEQKRLGLEEGLRRALIQTGGIITSCGVIMAGTFVSMMTGTLRGMMELGFALTLGVLLDTFVIRTLLVPAFFSLLARRESGRASPRSVRGNQVPHFAAAEPTKASEVR